MHPLVCIDALREQQRHKPSLDDGVCATAAFPGDVTPRLTQFGTEVSRWQQLYSRNQTSLSTHMRHRIPKLLRALSVGLTISIVASACVGGSDPAGSPTGVVEQAFRTVDSASASSSDTIDRPSMCVRLPTSNAAEGLMDNTYAFSPHEPVQLPNNPDWGENPLESNNWLFQYHTLRWSRSLLVGWQETGDEALLDRFRFLLSDWYADNPPDAPPSDFSWNDHSTAFRAMTYACASEFFDESWMQDALILHGETLADPDFYVKRGNHAFNQSLGLLAIGCRLGNQDWIDLATQRIANLVTESVDAQGVTNEQAVDYQLYNRRLYSQAQEWFAACELTPPTALLRASDMDDFLAHATMPNGDYVMIGDTAGHGAAADLSPSTEFAATAGVSGTRPESTSALFDAGFFFTRTGWGEERAFADEAYMSVRFGPPRTFHGHEDGGSITVYGYGTPLLIDAGKFTYNSGPERGYFVGPTAHNLVVVDGVPYLDRQETILEQIQSTERYDFLTLRRSIAEGTQWTREILFSRDGWILVVDRVDQDDTRRIQQLWHLVEDSHPTVDGTSVVTNRDYGNVAITQLTEIDEVVVVEGSDNPVQGWVSYKFDVREPAPTVIVSKSGERVVFATLLTPSPSIEVPEVHQVSIHDDAVSVDFTFLETRNRVSIVDGKVAIDASP